MCIRYVELELQIRIRHPKRTIHARVGRVRVDKVAARIGDVWVHVCAAAHPQGWFDRHELGGLAADQLVAKR